MGFEYELKFKASQELLSLLRETLPGEETVFAMATTYYDTPEGALSARQYTLRHRQENETYICTLKAPADVGRGEWETECDDITAAIPVLCKLGAPEDLESLTAGGITPVCGARFQRVAKLLTFEQTVLEVALDTGVLTGGGKEEPFWELEVELKSGDIRDADGFADQLARTFRLEPQTRSKFRRALALAEGE